MHGRHSVSIYCAEWQTCWRDALNNQKTTVVFVQILRIDIVELNLWVLWLSGALESQYYMCINKESFA